MPKSTNERILDKLDTMSAELANNTAGLRVINEQLKHIPTDVKMIEYVNGKLHGHFEAEHTEPPEPSQIIKLPSLHPRSKAAVDWAKTARNAVYIAAVVGPLTAAILSMG